MTMPPALQVMTDLGLWVQSHPMHVFGAMGGLFLLGLVPRLFRRSSPALDTHGSAQWATAREVRQAGLSRTHGVVLGVHGGTVWLDDRPTHVLLVAPTMGGKDTFHINPTLAWGWTQSALILDPKDGQTYDATAALRAQYGRVEAFAPYRSPLAKIDVLKTIRIGTPDEFGDALLIGQSLTAPEKIRHESSAGVHFRELSALTITAGSLHVRYTTSHGSLAAVSQFLTQQRSFPDALKLMETTAHTSHGVHQAIGQMAHVMRGIAEEELGGVWSTTLRPLLLYLDPYVAASTDTSTLSLEDLQYGPAPLALYLMAPSPGALGRLYPVYRVILDVLFARLMAHKPQTYPYRLLVVGNELPAYGYMQVVNKGAAVWRDYGIKGLFIAQDVHQLEEVYGVDAELWSNTDCKLFHTPANDHTAKRISENFLGKTTVEYAVISKQGLGRRSMTPHRTARALLDTAEVRQLNPAQLLVLLGGQPPMLMGKYGYDVRLAG